MDNLSEEEVFSNDEDPMEAIEKIRREEEKENTDDTSSQEESSTENTDTNEEESTDLNTEEKTDETEEEKTETVIDDENVDNKEEKNNSTEEDNNEESSEEKTEVKRKFTANGKEFEFTEKEIQEQFETVFGKAMNFTQKMQKIAPYRKMISALEEENITQDQLNIAIDALKGNKSALQELIKINDIDAFDLTKDADEEQDNYNPTDYGKNEEQLNIEDITNRISQDEEYKVTVDVIDHQWDQASRTALSNNPQMIEGLHNDIKTGMYDKVAPVAMKMKVLDGNTKSDIEYYILAGDKVMAEEQNSNKTEKTAADLNKPAQEAEDNFEQASSEADKRRAASSTRTRADREGVTDYLDDDDEKFDAWYKNLEASQ